MAGSSIERIGDWAQASNVTSRLRSVMRESTEIALRRLALKGEELAKKHISSQDLGWTALSPILSIELPAITFYSPQVYLLSIISNSQLPADHPRLLTAFYTVYH